jgi:hypothetical protein
MEKIEFDAELRENGELFVEAEDGYWPIEDILMREHLEEKLKDAKTGKVHVIISPAEPQEPVEIVETEEERELGDRLLREDMENQVKAKAWDKLKTEADVQYRRALKRRYRNLEQFWLNLRTAMKKLEAQAEPEGGQDG